MPATKSGPGSGKAAEPDSNEEDGFLLARMAGGDLSAFRRLTERHLSAVVATARRILADESEAEDVAQETMLRLWRLGGGLEISQLGARPWLKRVAANLSMDRQRAARRLVVTDDLPETPVGASQAHGLEAADTARRVGEAIGRLPERQRVALTLFHYDGMSQAEIAGMMGISGEAVESLLARARRFLREELRDQWRGLIEDSG